MCLIDLIVCCQSTITPNIYRAARRPEYKSPKSNRILWAKPAISISINWARHSWAQWNSGQGRHVHATWCVRSNQHYWQLNKSVLFSLGIHKAACNWTPSSSTKRTPPRTASSASRTLHPRWNSARKAKQKILQLASPERTRKTNTDRKKITEGDGTYRRLDEKMIGDIRYRSENFTYFLYFFNKNKLIYVKF